MIDWIYFALCCLLAVSVAIVAARCRATKLVIAGLFLASTAAAWIGYKAILRPKVLERETKAFEPLTERLSLAKQHAAANKFQAADSLLFQVMGEAKAIGGKWDALPETRDRSDQVRTEAGEALDRIRQRGQQLVNRVGKHLEARDYASAVRAVESAQLDADDGFSTAFQDYLWHVVNDEMKLAERRLSELPALGIDLKPLSRVLGVELTAMRERQNSIAQQVKAIVDAASHRQSFTPLRKGRAMVWDFTRGTIEDAYEMLPDDLRASSRDGVLTMFCIKRRWDVVVGTYQVSGKQGLQPHMDIAIVYWPSRECVGYVTVPGGLPPAVRPVQYNPSYGNSVKIKDWISSLPMDASASPSRTPVRTLADLLKRTEAEEKRDREEKARIAKAALPTPVVPPMPPTPKPAEPPPTPVVVPKFVPSLDPAVGKKQIVGIWESRPGSPGAKIVHQFFPNGRYASAIMVGGKVQNLAGEWELGASGQAYLVRVAAAVVAAGRPVGTPIITNTFVRFDDDDAMVITSPQGVAETFVRKR